MQGGSTALRFVADSFSGIAFVASRCGELEHLSPSFFEFTGLDPTYSVSDAMRAALHPEDASSVTTYWRACVETSNPFHALLRLQRRDGATPWFWAFSRLVGPPESRRARWFGVFLLMDDLAAVQLATEPGERAGPLVTALANRLSPPAPPWLAEAAERGAAALPLSDVRQQLTLAASVAAASVRLIDAATPASLRQASEMMEEMSGVLVGLGRQIGPNRAFGA